MSRESILWTSILAPPVIWFASLETNFALVPWACAFQWTVAIWITSAVGLAITAALAFAAYTQWKALGSEPPGDAGGALPRARYMAFLGITIAGMAFLVIVAQAVPAVMMGACQ